MVGFALILKKRIRRRAEINSHMIRKHLLIVMFSLSAIVFATSLRSCMEIDACLDKRASLAPISFEKLENVTAMPAHMIGK